MKTILPFFLIRMGLPFVLAGLTIALCFATPVTNQISEPGIDLKLPVFVGDYMGVAQEVSEGEKHILPPDTGIVRKLYRTLEGTEIVTSIVLAGEDSRSIHRPEICLPAQGWKIQSKQVLPFAMGQEERTMKLTCLTLTRPVELADGRSWDQQALYAYAFIGDGKSTPHNWERIFLTSYDRLFHGQNHRWAYIAFLVPIGINPETGAADPGLAMEALKSFLSETGDTFVPIEKET